MLLNQNRNLTYSSDVVANLLDIDEQQLIMLARKHQLAYRMIEWNDGEIQCIRFGSKYDRRPSSGLGAGIAFSAASEDMFWLEV